MNETDCENCAGKQQFAGMPGGTIGGLGLNQGIQRAQRERTVYEELTNDAEERLKQANAILTKRDRLTKQLGRFEMDQPVSAFRTKYDLNIWSV